MSTFPALTLAPAQGRRQLSMRACARRVNSQRALHRLLEGCGVEVAARPLHGCQQLVERDELEVVDLQNLASRDAGTGATGMNEWEGCRGRLAVTC